MEVTTGSPTDSKAKQKLLSQASGPRALMAKISGYSFWEPQYVSKLQVAE
jgi:hypothetical protein